MDFPIVYSKDENGERVLFCEGCGNTVPVSVEKYDDIMHKDGCRRKVILDALSSIPNINYTECKRGKTSTSVIFPSIARSCPAHKMAFDIVGLNSIVALNCSTIEECYKDYFEQYEGAILEAAKKLE